VKGGEKKNTGGQGAGAMNGRIKRGSGDKIEKHIWVVSVKSDRSPVGGQRKRKEGEKNYRGGR